MRITPLLLAAVAAVVFGPVPRARAQFDSNRLPFPALDYFPGSCVQGQKLTYLPGTPGANEYSCGAANNWILSTTVTPGCGIASSMPVSAHNGTYAILATDCGSSLTSNTAAAWTIPAAGSTGFPTGWSVYAANVGMSGNLVITATTSTFYGNGGAGSSGTLLPNTAVQLVSDGANWLVNSFTQAPVTCGGDLSGTESACTVVNGSHITDGNLPNPGYAGATFTASGSGCTTGTLVGGSTGGRLTLSGTVTTCVITITTGNSQTAADGWICAVADQTTKTIPWYGFGGAGSTITLSPISGSALTNDVIAFGCGKY